MDDRGMPQLAAVSLWNLPASSRQRRVVFAAAAALLAAFGIIAPFAGIQLLPLVSYNPSVEAIVFVNDLVTSILLFSQYAIGRSRAIFALAIGYLYTALIVLPHMLTYPGAFPGRVPGERCALAPRSRHDPKVDLGGERSLSAGARGGPGRNVTPRVKASPRAAKISTESTAKTLPCTLAVDEGPAPPAMPWPSRSLRSAAPPRTACTGRTRRRLPVPATASPRRRAR